MKNITQSGYETITVVRSQYEPTLGQCSTISPVLWIYENPHTKEKKYFLVLSSNNCINYIFQFKDIPEPELLKLITQCGEVTPNENGEIIHTGSCGARTVAEDCKDLCITLETGWGIKGGGTVCAGEKTKLELDLENTNIVTSTSDEVKDGDSVVYDGTDGKKIKKADQWRIGDGTNSWTGKYNPDSKNLSIFPDDKNDNPILTMLPNGVFLGNNQPKASARLIKSTPAFPTRTWYQVGATSAFEKFRDEDGYNKSANNFFPGDGNGKGAFYTFPYPGVWAIQYQFILDIGTNNKTNTRYLVRLTWGKEGSYKSLRSASQLGKNYTQIADCKLLPIEKDDICFVEINVDVNDAEVKPFLYAENNIRSIDNFIGFFLVVG